MPQYKKGFTKPYLNFKHFKLTGVLSNCFITMVTYYYYAMKITITCSLMTRHLCDTNIV